MSTGDVHCTMQNVACDNGFRSSEIDLAQLFAVARSHPKDYESPPCNADYLTDLMQDLNLLKVVQNEFVHVGTLLEKEIKRVRTNQEELALLPPPIGPIVMLNEKIYVPVHEYPNHNFVGRLIGPKGKTAKQLESETGCKIMIRGRGSMRNRKEEELYRGRRNYEHLYEDLHVIVSARDTENRAVIKLKKAVDEVKKFLRPWTEGEDELKNRQLMELAFIKNNNPSMIPTHLNHNEKFDNFMDKKVIQQPYNNLSQNFEPKNNYGALYMRRSPVGDSPSNANLNLIKKPNATGYEHLLKSVSPICSQESLQPNECCGDIRYGMKNLLDYMRNKPTIRDDNIYYPNEINPDQSHIQNFLEKYPNTNKFVPYGDERRPYGMNNIEFNNVKVENDHANGNQKPGKKQKLKKHDATANKRGNNHPSDNRVNAICPGGWFYEQTKATGVRKSN